MAEDIEQMKADLAALQRAEIELTTGARPVSIAYQGRSTTFAKAELPTIQRKIHELKLKLGMAKPRRALGVRFW
jgi:hypothetical protein